MTARDHRSRGGSSQGEQLALSLGMDGLSAFPGPAVVIDSQGSVIACNGRGEGLAAAAAQGRIACLADLLSMPGTTSLECLPLTGGGALVFDLVALPVGDGRSVLIGRDVTLERNLRAALVESRQRYKDLVEISSDFAWEIGPDGRFVFVSPKGALGHAADELIGRRPAEFVVQDTATPEANPFEANGPIEDVEVWMRQSDGAQVCVLISAMPLRGDGGEWRGTRGVCRDVTQERLRDAALSRANARERLLSYIVRTIRDEVEPSGMLQAAAEATARALGASGCQIFRLRPEDGGFALAAAFGEAGAGEDVLDSLADSDHFDSDYKSWRVLATVCRYRHSVNGAVLLWRSAERAAWGDDDRLLIDDVANQVGLAAEQIANHERVLKLSRTDGLTGLFNRRAFFEEIARRFQRLLREGRPAALIYVDLDNFKAVNDVHGHQTGDRALLAVRDLMVQHTRPTDLIARLGGDEFAIWLEAAEEKIAVRRCEELLTAGAQLTCYSGSPDKPLLFSLGVAVHSGGEAETIEALIARADKAMYEVKRGGKGAWRLAPQLSGQPRPGESEPSWRDS
ncbi:sensor domain-containing diguanylate cyclase [Magnetospirillum fulvum]|uniref:PAS domain S-box-containing protein/diguanylate cyclase (GGDEF) domain-containing protein n=1 Tax=Magnetospirillum fulvum TaxID=1082 RepID=A0A1H6GW91_MAGFU|nr:sensor domain-containing diguanylate cyclase [Magnetospirillum fulvum]SEH27739.1 PAS domain S-box-containing protein/diguanylate cyclase (GGDEF) domain-containing protein [Magnetospirillum fulvum]